MPSPWTCLDRWRNQFVLGPKTWNPSASLVKAVRINMDFFNVLNMPGISMPAANGILPNQLSNNQPRNLQTTMRLPW